MSGGKPGAGSVGGTGEATGSSGTLTVAPLTAALSERVLGLEVAPAQSRFVASNSASLEEYRAEPDLRPFAILADGVVVGFAMYEESRDDDGTIELNIFRLMIDRRHQGRGYGGKALEMLVARLLADPRPRRITTCFVPENWVARRMYASLGFVETEVDEDGEIVAELMTSRSGHGG